MTRTPPWGVFLWSKKIERIRLNESSRIIRDNLRAQTWRLVSRKPIRVLKIKSFIKIDEETWLILRRVIGHLHKKLTNPLPKTFLKKSKKWRDCRGVKWKKLIDSKKTAQRQNSSLKSPLPLMNMRDRWITNRVGGKSYDAHDLPLFLIRLPIAWSSSQHRCVHRR